MRRRRRRGGVAAAGAAAAAILNRRVPGRRDSSVLLVLHDESGVIHLIALSGCVAVCLCALAHITLEPRDSHSVLGVAGNTCSLRWTCDEEAMMN